VNKIELTKRLNLPAVHMYQCFFHASLEEGISPLPKKLTISAPNGCQIVCAKFFSAVKMNYKYHRNSLLTGNKNRKLFATKQSKACKFTPKMLENTFGGLALPGPAGGANAHPQTSWPQWGPTSKGDEREGREEKGDENVGGGNSPSKVKVSRINTDK